MVCFSCVSESGFTWSVKGWLALHADNAQLQQFAAQLHRTRQLVFHAHTQTATTATGSAVGHAPVDTTALCAKFAFDSVEDDGATLASASLAAPDSSFSLAAFLDQHLQAPPATARGTASPLELQRNEVAAVAAVRTELQQLQHHWQEQQQEAARINPPLVAAESARVNHYLEQVTALGHAHADVQARLRAHLEAAQPLHARVAALQSNMAFIQHVQLYEHLLRQATELSERCRETLGGHDAPHAAATGGADGDAVAVSASALDMHNVHSVCAMFLRLLRIYQGLRDTTRVHSSADGTAPKGDNDAHEASEKKGGDDAPPVARSWSGVLHLQRMVRTRILSILQPLKGRLIQLYQQTLAALHWPQTSNTLLLGLHTLPPVPTAASGNGAAPVPVSSPSAHSLDSSLQLFDLLTENLIRIQMLLSECGMHDEIRRIEREIDGSAARHAAAAAAAAASSASEKKGDSVSVPRLWVLSLLLQPIYKRFYYHFDSSAAVVSAPELSAADPASSGGVGGGASSAAVAAASLTNRLDKPEWVCTFLEKSFVDHRDFLQQRVQPIVNRCHFQPPALRDEQAQAAGVVAAPVASTSKFQHYEFAMEFLEALLGFYHAKLIRPSTQAALLSNPLLLRHTLDELMSFEAKLEAMYGYPVQSSRRLSLLDAFLRQRSSFDALLKNERDSVNRALDALRNLDQPWQLVSRKGHAAKDDADSSDDEDADAGVQGLSAADSAQLEGGGGGGGGVDDALDGSSSLLHSAASATNSSHAFLSLISSLTRRYRSFKFLNLRLHVLKELQFKLFEIYEEDLIREFQDNWKRLATNARAGGLQYLMLERGGKGAGVGGGGRRSKAARLNPLRYWSTHCGLLNSIYYIATILREWNDEFIFLELYYFYTHKSKIQSSLLQAHHAHAVDPSAPVPVGGILVPSATAAGAATAAGTEEEEVLITSEELALWMTSGGSAVMPGSAAGAVVPAAAAATAAAAAERENQRAQVSSGASGVASYLPEGFQRTVKQLQALSSLETHSALSASSGFASASASVASPFMAPSLTPTSDSLFPKLTSSEGRGAGGGASRSTLPSSSVFSLPLELQMSGTLFEPILASYSSLREEMLHSLVGVVASHFRDALHQHGHVARGHMDAEHGAHGAAFRHPDLDHFFARAQAAPEGTAPALVADWMLLEHHVDISTTLCQPLLDLKMQLIVVHHSLTQSVAAASCAWAPCVQASRHCAIDFDCVLTPRWFFVPLLFLCFAQTTAPLFLDRRRCQAQPAPVRRAGEWAVLHPPGQSAVHARHARHICAVRNLSTDAVGGQWWRQRRQRQRAQSALQTRAGHHQSAAAVISAAVGSAGAADPRRPGLGVRSIRAPVPRAPAPPSAEAQRHAGAGSDRAHSPRRRRPVARRLARCGAASQRRSRGRG